MGPGTPAFRERYGPWALVAGASDGIGEAFARQLAAAGIHLVLLARREPLLRALAEELASAHGIATRCVVADLTAPDVMDRVSEQAAGLEIGLLVCNAGATHGAATLLERPVDAALALVELNCRTPLRLVHHFGTGMRQRRRGGIVLLSSLASLSGGGLTAVYNATKSFDLILAEGLWHELKPDGVDAMCLMVGATRTPGMLGSRPSFAQYPGIMEPAEVAAEGLAFLGHGPLWVAGEHNRAIVRQLLPVPRVGQINALSAATASIYGRPADPREGEDF
jgi:short-subunit dehydrogenase